MHRKSADAAPPGLDEHAVPRFHLRRGEHVPGRQRRPRRRGAGHPVDPVGQRARILRPGKRILRVAAGIFFRARQPSRAGLHRWKRHDALSRRKLSNIRAGLDYGSSELAAEDERQILRANMDVSVLPDEGRSG